MANVAPPNVNCLSAAAQRLVEKLTPLIDRGRERTDPAMDRDASGNDDETRNDILAAIRDLVPSLDPNDSIFVGYHNGRSENPLGGGSYAFQHDIVGPVLNALVDDEVLEGSRSARSSP
ncbi:hypothetical protein QBC42DRAFT_280566 [Cladorrhinum samala]|uniref:Uncharacterized protein n=1 Tax=Cladorrhinum samala TaxID=585594 RepID=A0AAV9H7Q7_9PEZI|nr:hypothetical protein QBC42DRAFT_280566 [Cladorrhinum samala]